MRRDFVIIPGLPRICLGFATTPAPVSVTGAPSPILHQRATTDFSTCGYVDGDISKPRIAPKGFNCRVDTLNGLWGFCPTSVIAATDCGLGGFCFDGGSCSTGCGRPSLKNNPKIKTWTCPEADDGPEARFCSTASLIFGPDQTYDYIDCAKNPGKAIYFFSPTAQATISQLSSSTVLANTTPPLTSTTSLPSRTEGSVDAGTSSSTSAAITQETGGLNIGALVGGILGGLALIAGAIMALLYLRKYKARQSSGAREGLFYQGQLPPSSPITAPGGRKPSELIGSVQAAGELPASVERGASVAELAGDDWRR